MLGKSIPPGLCWIVNDSIFATLLQSRPSILRRKLDELSEKLPDASGGSVVGGVTSRASSGARFTVINAGAFDEPSSFGMVVLATTALTNSRRETGLPLEPTRIIAPFF